MTCLCVLCCATAEPLSNEDKYFNILLFNPETSRRKHTPTAPHAHGDESTYFFLAATAIAGYACKAHNVYAAHKSNVPNSLQRSRI